MPRPPWSSLPPPVRDWAEQLLGGGIVEAASKPGGFSPGTADVVTASSARRAFIKAVGRELNEFSPELHRREIEVMRMLPPSAPVPRLLGSYDDGDWVALALEVIDGEQPSLPWTDAQLEATLDACFVLRRVEVPPGLGHVRDEFEPYRDAWLELGAQPLPAGLTSEALVELAAQPGTLDGESLLHLDLRADNVLIRPDGSAVLVDWPWAVRGPAWLDPLTLLCNVRLHDPQYPADALLQRHPSFEGASADAVNSTLALLAGFFVRQSLKPPQKGVEAVRAFQREQAEAILQWLGERLAGL